MIRSLALSNSWLFHLSIAILSRPTYLLTHSFIHIRLILKVDRTQQLLSGYWLCVAARCRNVTVCWGYHCMLTSARALMMVVRMVECALHTQRASTHTQLADA